MKHRICINFIVVLALALGSGGIVLGGQPAVQAAPTEAGLHAPQGEHLASGERSDYYTANAVSVDYIGHIGGATYAVAVAGQYAYVGEGASLTILDVSAPSAPAVVGRSEFLPGLVQDVAVAGSYAYVLAADYMTAGSLRVIDVSDPASPVEIGFYDTPNYAYGVAVAGSYAYVANGSSGLWVIDVSEPASPFEVGFFDTPGVAWGAAVTGGYAYVADGGSLRVIDVSNPVNPIEVGNAPGWAQDVAVAGAYAYVVDEFFGLGVVDVSDPANPIWVSFTATPESALSLAVAGSYAYVATAASDASGWLGSLRVFDVSNPASPSDVGSYDTTALPMAWRWLGAMPTWRMGAAWG